ncbi:DUF916 domain-containing protein [Auritidibacter ignavus]|uniref:DUF916 domain-containing protein n=1 Tax=Auritidibacter ignavus TaxID=678932 RepID=A0AAJ6ALX2_9MICC|nr:MULTISPECIES: DUF916 domain-containing protein [Auritidibacter]WGH80708.1 DUF916 domain-containing protein [Auritidibacter ignavus]WGH89930.1 DUF916 domain-containing protein [Auritidibacter ignavus]WGH92214.1 DUF916 domain-containing protein [Auritidibacter ignavus]
MTTRLTVPAAVITTLLSALLCLIPYTPTVATAATPETPASAKLPATDQSLSPDQTETWGIAPADNDYGTGRSSFAYQVSAGETIEDQMVVVNYGAEELTLNTTIADAETSVDGTLSLKEPGQEPTGLELWGTVETESITVAPGESKTVAFTIEVPADATPGDHLGGVVTSRLSEGDGQVAVNHRLASQIRITVDGEVIPALEINEISIVDAPVAWIPFAPVEATVRYEVTNTGNALTRINPDNSVWLGAVHESDATDQDSSTVLELMPSGTGIVEERATIWPIGYHHATVKLTPEAVSGALGEPVEANGSGIIIPWGTLVVLLVVSGGIIAYVVTTRRRHTQQADPAKPQSPRQ